MDAGDDTYLRERIAVRQGQYTWDDARGAWVDAMGTPLDTADFEYLVSSRANAYYSRPIP